MARGLISGSSDPADLHPALGAPAGAPAGGSVPETDTPLNDGGVLTPGPETKVVRTATPVAPYDHKTGKLMTDAQKNIKTMRGSEYYDPGAADMKGQGEFDYPEGHPERGIHTPFGQPSPSDDQVLQNAHEEDVASLPPSEQSQPSPTVQVPPGYAARGPFNQPGGVVQDARNLGGQLPQMVEPETKASH